MEIIIENCSSPGAHFSNNTNMVMMKIYHWITENKKPELPFIDFRRRLEAEKGINDNNARNIYPLLKNGGLVEYQAGGELATESFFTKRGLAYLKALETKDLIDQNEEYTKKQKEEAGRHIDEILEDIVYSSIELLVENKELNYTQSLIWYLLFLSKFGKINKQEFALMIFFMSKGEENWEDGITPLIKQYRAQQIDINVKVRVRNDQKIQIRTGEKTRLENIDFFTSYSYFSSLIDQAGLTRKIKDYHCVDESRKTKIDYLLEV